MILLSFESTDDVWGRCTNPHNSAYSPGRSTGGGGGSHSSRRPYWHAPCPFQRNLLASSLTSRWPKMGHEYFDARMSALFHRHPIHGPSPWPKSSERMDPRSRDISSISPIQESALRPCAAEFTDWDYLGNPNAILKACPEFSGGYTRIVVVHYPMGSLL